MISKLFFIILLFFTSLGQANFNISYDTSGFPVCATQENGSGSKTYFFSWDPWTRSEIQTVFYFDQESYIHATGHFIHGCKDLKYIKDIPPEIMIPLNLDAGLFPDSIHFALAQVSQGGHLFHAEKKPADFIQARIERFKYNEPEVLTRLKYEGGKVWAQKVVSVWTATAFGRNQSCQNYIGSCDFYLCQDKKNPCGVDGYNLSFGYKYCSGSQFSLLKNMQTATGKKWVRQVISCLQRKSLTVSKLLNGNLSTNLRCEKIQSESFNSHPDCYVESGFCELPLQEKMHIVALIKNEIFTQNTFSEAANILKLCEDRL